MSKKTIYIAEDHKILRDGLKLIISSLDNVKIIGESGDGRKALEEVLNLRPDLLILDISMPSMLGLDVAQHIFKKNKKCKIIILTKHDNIEYLKRLLKYKIGAYVLKDEAATDLIKAIHSVFNNTFYLSPKLSSRLNTSKESPEEKEKNKATLTQREREIVKLIAEDKSTVDIAEILFISPKTVKTHRSNIFKKLKISSLTELIKYAIANDFIDLL